MKPLILIGGGGHCKSCIDIIEQEQQFKIIGILDSNLSQQGILEVLGYPILGGDEQLPLIRKQVSNALITIGQIKTALVRKKLYKILKKLDFHLPTIISPLAYVSRYATIQEGSIVMHHAMINASVSIGKMCIINTKALIEHDCIIQDFCHISTGAILNGGCIVGKQSFIGSNMGIKQNTEIKEKQIIYIDSYKGGGG